MDIQAYLDFSLAPLAQIPSTELEQLHREFMQTVIEPMRLERADYLIQQHRDAGDRLLVITSTNRFIVEPICQSLGIDELLATDLEMIDGRYTGKIVGTPHLSRGQGRAL